MNRREFVKSMAATGVSAAALSSASAAPDDGPRPTETVRGDMRFRALGRTGEQVSVIGLGGYHIGIQPDEQESIKIIRGAVDAGINFLDNCWDYNDGGSEVRMGKALRDGYRNKVFLMTKFDGRTRAAAARQVDESLKRLQTDHIDLVQHHEVIRMEDPDRIFAEGGANEALVEARKAGKIRFIGFTGHKDPAVHLRMLEVAAKHHFHFDTAQMPINVMDAHFRSFHRHVVPELLKQGIALLGMKPLGGGMILQSKTASATECLHFALSQPTSVVITGIDTMKILQQALEAVRTFKPLTDEQSAALLQRTQEAAVTGMYERFKTTAAFDATARHPEWLG